MIFDYFSYYMLIRLSELLDYYWVAGLGQISFMRLERTSNQ